ncbi:MAG: hypothetical protein E6I28_02390 [Chloroflexi bacterium]|nr:MAG: hypothetical protein E6I28_02390 [Chloroflexota bacterium]
MIVVQPVGSGLLVGDGDGVGDGVGLGIGVGLGDAVAVSAPHAANRSAATTNRRLQRMRRMLGTATSRQPRSHRIFSGGVEVPLMRRCVHSRTVGDELAVSRASRNEGDTR